ncbi:MAG: hypothetical protein EDS66_07905 [Planctomycetota bacterium]|nr:MAG: hypothetical protein EDS66_07905 [Planctomycetota bacterium]MCQ3921571.1 hypothetical protein [Planctomycetota bacterium]
MTRRGDRVKREEIRGGVAARPEASRTRGARRGGVRRGGARREGVALVVVVALLGILFVVGVVFLRSMRFETNSLASQQKRVDRESAIASVMNVVSGVLVEGVVGQGGAPYASSQMNGLLDGSGRPIRPTYGEVYGVHTLFGQAEAEAVDPANPYQGSRAFVISSDVERIVSGAPFVIPPSRGNPDMRTVLTAPATDYDNDGAITSADWVLDGEDADGNPIKLWQDGYIAIFGGSPAADGVADWADADGDGVNDARSVSLRAFGLPEEEIRALAREVNEPLNMTADPSLALKVVDHGAMVNLSWSHPLLVNTILTNDYKVRPSNWSGQLSREYSPTTEEPVLRRRGGLIPPRQLPVTKLHGNPFVLDSGELTDKLLVQYPALGAGQWHWWTLRFNEDFDGTGDAWLYNVMSTRGTATDPGSGGWYDRRRHLTTVSHDDLFARGVELSGGRDLQDRMRRLYLQNRGNSDPLVLSSLPFLKFYQYPCVDVDDDGSADVNSCPDFDGDGLTELTVAGRLMLSLPWIEDVLLDPVDGINGFRTDYAHPRVQTAIGLIQANFTAMLLNHATGPDGNGDGLPDQLAEFFRGNVNFEGVPQIGDVDGSGAVDRFDLIAVLAASLTANLIDYADQDVDHLIQDGLGRYVPDYENYEYDDPSTPIPIRVSNPTSARFGQVVTYLDAFGQQQIESVYGVERQPYITEVVAMRPRVPLYTGYAVELFSPYNDRLFDLRRYAIYVVNQGQAFEAGKLYRIDQNETFPVLPQPAELINTPPLSRPPGYFRVLLNGQSGDPKSHPFFEQCQEVAPNTVYYMDAPSQAFEFENGDTIYLVKFNSGFNGAFHPVDQFFLNDPEMAVEEQYNRSPYETGHSMERPMRRQSDADQGLNIVHNWMVPVAHALEFDAFTDADECRHSLGTWNELFVENDYDGNEAIRNVEVEFADTGQLRTAYPTTGSMLYLMRYANQRTGAFTRLLQQEKNQVDNGRLPVFDNGFIGVDGNGNPVQVYWHHVDPTLSAANVPGGVKQLPWGQSVFDHFTSLPLGSVKDVDWDFTSPYVDAGGLRVSGRINLNSAPWSVLAGLPVRKAADMPRGYYFDKTWDSNGRILYQMKDRMRIAMEQPLLSDAERQNGDQLDPNATYPIGYRLAKAIAAYRGATQLDDVDGANNPEATGNYESERSWSGAAARRRGTGFVSVGELANLRAASASDTIPDWYSAYRFDLGISDRRVDLGRGPVMREDFAEAVSLLAALGDWTTTRSHVFTVYGTVRGSADFDGNGALDSAEGTRVDELERRAIRFQETVDRLPAILGKPAPSRIGERVIALQSGTYFD